MSAIGSLVFCIDCGNLLESSTGDAKTVLVCDCCGAHNQDSSSKSVTTKSKPSDFPSKLRQMRSSIQNIDEEESRKNDATIQMTCPECNRPEVRYYTLQLRSADEGSTVFYTCECGYKWNTNN